MNTTVVSSAASQLQESCGMMVYKIGRLGHWMLGLAVEGRGKVSSQFLFFSKASHLP